MKPFHAPNRSYPTPLITYDLKRIHYTERVSHTHRGIELTYVKSGEALQTVYPADGSAPFTSTVKHGNYYFISYGTKHSYQNGSDDFEVINFMLKPFVLDPRLSEDSSVEEIEKILLSDAGDNLHIPFDKICSDYENQMEVIFERIYSLMSSNVFGIQTFYRSYALEILVTAVNQNLINRPEDTGSIADIVKNYIDAFYANRLSLSDISAKFHYAPQYVSRKFKEKYGLSFEEYLHRVRIAQACKLLTDTNLSINEISESVSYSSAIPFRRVFKKITGLTPGEYRASNRS